MEHTNKEFFFPTFARMEALKQAQSQQPSKSSIANAIFKQMFNQQPVPQRKDMIKRVMNEAKLTEKGAATYLQNYKAKHGLTKPKVVA